MCGRYLAMLDEMWPSVDKMWPSVDEMYTLVWVRCSIGRMRFVPFVDGMYHSVDEI